LSGRPVTADPRVTIITPAYNAQRTLAATLDSALRQTMSDFELIVVDDGSTDGTAAIAESYAALDSRVRLIRQSNGGSAGARNTAFGVSRGGLFALLDSDDLWMPDFLARQLAILDEHPDIDIVSANAFNLGGELDGTPLKPSSDAWAPVSLLDLIEVEDSVCIMTVFRRRVLERTGGFNPAVPDNEDYDLWLRAACAGCTIVFNSRPSGYYRRHSDSKSANEARMLEGIVSVLTGARALCANRPREVAAIDRQIARFGRRRLLVAGKTALVHGNFVEAAEAFEQLDAPGTGSRDRAIARIGRRVPRLVLWGYFASRACRTLLRRASQVQTFA
jgi:glycosyltransferase involved in cell wall biosynthesis